MNDVVLGSIGHYEAIMERERYLMKRSEGEVEWNKHWDAFQIAKTQMTRAYEARRLADIAQGYEE